MILGKQDGDTNEVLYRAQTPLLDFSSPVIRKVIDRYRWRELSTTYARIGAIHTFMRDEIPYGYNREFCHPASSILQDGYGMAITKSTLMMAFLRALDIPCRFHGATIDTSIERGIRGPLDQLFAPKEVYHGWVEVSYGGQWIRLEGFIVDKPYIEQVQQRFFNHVGSFYAFGMAVLNFRNPDIVWEGKETSIQCKAVNQDLGTFHDPDTFFDLHPEARKLDHRFRINDLNKHIAKVRKG